MSYLTHGQRRRRRPSIPGTIVLLLIVLVCATIWGLVIFAGIEAWRLL